MELAHEIKDGVAVLSVSGQANQAPDRVSFHDYIKTLASDGHSLIVIDFSELTWIGSNLLGALIASYCSLRASGGGLRVIGAAPKVVQAIEFNRLSNVISVEESVDGAIRSLWDNPEGDTAS